VILIHEKLNHLALSVPEISTSNYHEQVNSGQGHETSFESAGGGGWMSSSLPVHTVVTISPDSGGGKALNNVLFTDPKSPNKILPINQNAEEGQQPPLLPLVPANSRSAHGWFNGLLGCLRPVWTSKFSFNLVRQNKENIMIE